MKRLDLRREKRYLSSERGREMSHFNIKEEIHGILYELICEGIVGKIDDILYPIYDDVKLRIHTFVDIYC